MKTHQEIHDAIEKSNATFGHGEIIKILHALNDRIADLAKDNAALEKRIRSVELGFPDIVKP